MVSNARDDLPEPLTPVMTIRRLAGSDTSMFFRLWVRAPRTTIGLRCRAAFGRVSCMGGDSGRNHNLPSYYGRPREARQRDLPRNRRASAVFLGWADGDG